MSSSAEFETEGGAPSPSSLLEPQNQQSGGGSGGGANFEHPLTAATSAMLNIASDDGSGAGGFNVFYDIYGKTLSSEHGLLSAKERSVTADIWSPVTNSKLSGGSELGEIYVTSGSKLGSVLRRGDKLKLNGQPHESVIVVKQEELNPHSPASPSRLNGILGVAGQEESYPSAGVFATLNSSHYADYGTVVSSPQQFSLGSNSRIVGGGVYSTEPYYRDYFPPDYVPANATRVISGYDGPLGGNVNGNGSNGNGEQQISYRATIIGGGPYKNPVTIDVNSPDSGIGGESITPRDHSTAQQGFDYNDMVGQGLMGEMSGGSSNAGSVTGRTTPASGVTPTGQKATRPWHEFGRTSENDKIQIAKLFLSSGFRYYLESPISTSQRREDDRITYINKGQFYGITLDFLPDPDKPIKSQTVKSVVMLVFREEKSPEDEIKAWQFWHSRQHSVKQRILDADTKNSVGLVGCIDEIAHNAIAVYWNPLESAAKINVAVQCLSTDFSSQKGVKGLPLHLQIDTYDDPRDPNCPVYHRGYSQIKVFCDKGAERKTRDEERRAAKRKLTATGRKKLDELYHTPAERTEFYSMSDMAKPPVLFSPAEDLDKVNLTPLAEFHGYYGGGNSSEQSIESAAEPKGDEGGPTHILSFASPQESEGGLGSPALKRLRLVPSSGERLMIYVRQEGEPIFTPVHLVPPTTLGLLSALEDKFKLSMASVKNLFRRSAKGIVAKVDDEMLKHYCHEDTFLLEVKPSENDDAFDVTLAETSQGE